MGSADWMPRNLDRRVEIVFPVEDERIKDEIKHVLDLEFRDNERPIFFSLMELMRSKDKRVRSLSIPRWNSAMRHRKKAKEA